jgi:hypothetical protein
MVVVNGECGGGYWPSGPVSSGSIDRMAATAQGAGVMVSARLRPCACLKSFKTLPVAQMSAHSLSAADRLRHMSRRIPRFSLVGAPGTVICKVAAGSRADRG